MNPVCTKCYVEFRVKVNGIVAVAMAVYGPMEIRRADVWECPVCGVAMIHKWASEAELSHFDPAFEDRLNSYMNDPRQTVMRYWMNARERKQYDDCNTRRVEQAAMRELMKK